LSFVIGAEAQSWVAYAPESHFPIQNLPFGLALFDQPSIVVAIGDYALHLALLAEQKALPYEPYELWDFAMVMERGGRSALSTLRRQVFELLEASNPLLRDDAELRARALVPLDELTLIPPFEIGQFVDFYSGIHHASNVGKMFRPDQPPLLPNYRWLPVAYNGRASSVFVSGQTITRPCGQSKAPDDDAPHFGPTRELDFELEMGFFLASGTAAGETIPISEAEQYIAGLVLVNDWSARDIQRWEYQPLGPFLAKSFATTISPWLVTLDALEPFREAGMARDPKPLPYLRSPGPGHFDIHLEVSLRSEKMRSPQVISRSNTRYLYWTMAQQLAHQASNGTPLEVGDLLASGTISGPEPGTYGSLLELTWRGRDPILLDESGETRTFLEDGDELVLTGWAQGEGYRVGFGTAVGKVLPAAQQS
jgi:fumarylacetoacetase